jgi:hypothetical protein
MTSNATSTGTPHPRTDWQVEYDVDPIEVRDPVAETLGVLVGMERLLVRRSVPFEASATLA